MGTTIRNARPSVLHIPDAGLRLEPGQTRSVAALSPQTEALLVAGALQVVPVAAAPRPAPVEPGPAAAPSPVRADAESRATGRRGGHKPPTLPISPEAADDTC